MNEFLDRISKLSPERLKLVALELQARVEDLERNTREPIAVIGMGCRLPGGAHDPGRLWLLLRDGVDAVVDVPGDRWDVDAYHDADPAAPGKTCMRRGGFLERIDEFDPRFFGILPGEARAMDPQQRLVLEVAWEAIEDAGIAADRLSGSRTGVFVGIGGQDFAQLVTSQEPESLHGHIASGISPSIAAGRLSYLLGLVGPSMAIDTSCSSSLVAISLACDHLRARKCSMALAGGVNVILTPATSIMLSKSGMMARDGRCKTFDASADGFGRGEGCGFVALKRLSDAQQDGDRILAVIRGTAVNQDGRSAGLTAPNGPAQQALLREALADAGLRPDQVQYVEAHGTGTSLGDPIEVQALAAVLGEGRSSGNPLMIGSVKTNIGHLECAAGVAGFIKAVLALHHAEIPRHLHLNSPNPHINWAELPVSVPTRTTPWPAVPGPRIAGISSFGFSGTNAHVLIEEAPDDLPRGDGPDRPLHLLCISARSEAALDQLARRHRRRLAGDPSVRPADVCYTANTGRSHFAHRVTVLGGSREELARGLDDFVERAPGPGFAVGRVDGDRPFADGVVFLFTDSGRLHVGAGRQLLETQPTFRRAFNHCVGGLVDLGVMPAGDASLAVGEPYSFALRYALVEVLRSWGLEPAATLGSGCGAISAACARGEMGLERALQQVAGRVGPVPPSSSGSNGSVSGLRDVHRGQTSDVDGFLDGVRALYEQGHRVFLEIGHDPVLRELAGNVLPEGDYLWLPTLSPAQDDWRALLETVATLHSRGINVDWSGFDRDYPRRKVALPLYPFERNRYWPDIKTAPRRTPAPAARTDWRNWLYEPRWEPQPASVGIPSIPGGRNGSPYGSSAEGRWLIFADRHGWGRNLAEALGQAGGEPTMVHPPRDGDDLEVLRPFLGSDPRPCRGVIDLRAMDEAIDEATGVDELRATQRRACGGLLQLVQALVRSGRHEVPPLTVVTLGAQSAGDAPRPMQPAQATLWGLGRVIALEHPDLRCRRIDLDPHGGPGQAAALAEELIRPDRSEEEVAFRAGRRLVPRLTRHHVRDEPGASAVVDDGGYYLVTGALTGLGLSTSRWLVDQGTRHLVLAGRGAPSPGALQTIDAMERAGTTVLVVQADVSRREDVDRILRRIEGTGVPLRGLIHSAGTFDDGVLLEQRWERFESVMAAKVAGAWNLHQATRGLRLDFFVLYSSGASLLGSAGQGNYAAANAFLDGLAHYRRTLGLPGLAINWGPWAEVGRGAAMRGRHAARRTAQGLGLIDPARGFDALRLLLSQDRPQVAVLPVDWSRPDHLPTASDPLPPLLRSTADREARAAGAAPAADGPSDMRTRLRLASPDERRPLFVDLVHRTVTQLFNDDRSQPIGTDDNLPGLGMDSLMAIQLANQLNRSLGIRLQTTIAFDHPTIDALADHLLEAVSLHETSNGDGAAGEAATAPPPAESEPEEIAIAQRAQRALHDLGRISDAEVDALLHDLLTARGNES